MLKRLHKKLPLRQAPPQTGTKSFLAPIGGLHTNENAAIQSGKPVARVLDNYWPMRRGIRPRLGSVKHATVDASNDVTSMWVYRAGSTQTLFGADAAAIYDITSPADPDVVPTAAVSSLNDGYYATQMFINSAGAYQYCVNGSTSDTPYLYDGSTWTSITGASSPAITGVTTTDIVGVFSHGKRLWFIEGGSQSAWYLPVDAIGGAATEFLLSGLFENGGNLLIGTTWSLDTGDGMDDKCVFVSDKGDVVVYAGTDPSDATKWSLEGSYTMAPVLSKKAMYKIGGVPHFATAEGIISLQDVIARDQSYHMATSQSLPINDQWRTENITRITTPWKTEVWDNMNMLVVCSPKTEAADDMQYWVQNIETGAWARWINYDVTCAAFIDGTGYVGDASGDVYQIEIGGDDNDTAYTCLCIMEYNHLDAPGRTKTLKSARMNWLARNAVNARIGAVVNYSTDGLGSYPSSISATTEDVWDTGLWDTALWSAASGDEAAVETNWRSIGRTGFAHALTIQQTFGISTAHYEELVSIDVIYEMGNIGT